MLPTWKRKVPNADTHPQAIETVYWWRGFKSTKAEEHWTQAISVLLFPGILENRFLFLYHFCRDRRFQRLSTLIHPWSSTCRDVDRIIGRVRFLIEVSMAEFILLQASTVHLIAYTSLFNFGLTLNWDKSSDKIRQSPVFPSVTNSDDSKGTK